MIKLSLICILLFEASTSYCQYRHELIKDTSWYKNTPLVILKTNKKIFPPSRYYVIDYGYIASTKIDKGDEYISTAGDSIKIIRLRNGVKLLGLYELLAKFHIRAEYYNLPVYIDSILVYRPENASFQRSAVTSIKIQEEKKTHIKYISVASIHHTNNPIADVYIFGTIASPKN